MKYLIIPLLFISSNLFSQNVLKFTATYLKFVSTEQSWREVEWQKTDIPVTLRDNGSSIRLMIYSKETQTYYLYKLIDETDNYEYSAITYVSEDYEGFRCHITIKNYKSEESYDQVIIAYSDYQWAYCIE